jgi:glutaredoxin 3
MAADPAIGDGWGSGLEKSQARTHIATSPSPRKFPEFPLSDPSQASAGPEITLYTSAMCGYCVAAKNFLKSRGLQWNEVRIDTDPVLRERMVALARRTSVPQIFIGQTHVGGYDDLMALHRAGKLEPLLAGGA